MLAGLAFYPMLVLLLIVLATIHLTDRLGVTSAAALLTLGWMLFWWARLYAPSKNRPVIPVSLMWMSILGICFGAVHDHQTRQVRRQLQRWNQANTESGSDPASTQSWKPVVVQGTIEQSPRLRRATIPNPSSKSGDPIDDWQTLTEIRISSVQQKNSWSELSLRATLVIDGRLAELLPGDSVQVFGHWRRPPEPSNPGQFDLRNRYAELGIAAQLKSESPNLVQRLKSGSAWRLDRWLAKWTQHALVAIEDYVPMGQAPLTAALVLGQREQADWQFQEQMLATGTIHMLSISGMHIEMVALTLLVCGWMLRMPKGLVLTGTVCVCSLYALLCGANPPVARATIMLGAACLARFLGWSYNSLNILAFAGLVLLTQRTSIAFEVGTQLSFLTVAVLILTFPLFRNRTAPIQRLMESKETWVGKSRRGLWYLCRESIRSSFWVSFLSAPLVWSSFHIISPISIVLNLLLWFPMLIALLAGLGLVLFFWIPPLAYLLGACCGFALWALSAIVAIADRIPYGHFWAASPPVWWLVGFYILAFALSVWLGTNRSVGRRALLWTLGCWFALGPLWILSHNTLQRTGLVGAQSPLLVTFIDVGHGTCVLIETPDGRNWLYDAGRLGDHQRSYQPIAQSLWAMGIERIDGLFLSHADSDHYNAMEGLIERFSIHKFITTQAVLQHPSPTLHALLNKVQQHRIPLERWSCGSGLGSDGRYTMQAIYPIEPSSAPPFRLASNRNSKSRQRPLSDNAKSLCLVIEFAHIRILLPGDLEAPGTQALVDQPPLKIDVLMAPHHGSLSTEQDGLIAWCQPSSVVISGSHRSLNAQVLKAYSPSGQNVLHTARDHALQLRIESDGKMQWSRWSENRWIIHAL